MQAAMLSARFSVVAAPRPCSSRQQLRVQAAAPASPAKAGAAKGGKPAAAGAPGTGKGKKAAAKKATAPLAAAPTGPLHKYETMMLLRPDCTPTERADEVKKAETLLVAHGVSDLEVLVREPSATAYPIKGHNTMYYVQLNFSTIPSVIPELHKMFNTPVVGKEPTLLRFMTLRQ